MDTVTVHTPLGGGCGAGVGVGDVVGVGGFGRIGCGVGTSGRVGGEVGGLVGGEVGGEVGGLVGGLWAARWVARWAACGRARGQRGRWRVWAALARGLWAGLWAGLLAAERAARWAARWAGCWRRCGRRGGRRRRWRGENLRPREEEADRRVLVPGRQANGLLQVVQPLPDELPPARHALSYTNRAATCWLAVITSRRYDAGHDVELHGTSRKLLKGRNGRPTRACQAQLGQQLGHVRVCTSGPGLTVYQSPFIEFSPPTMPPAQHPPISAQPVTHASRQNCIKV